MSSTTARSTITIGAVSRPGRCRSRRDVPGEGQWCPLAALALGPVVDLHGLEDHLDTLQDVAIVRRGVDHFGDEDTFHVHPEEGTGPRALRRVDHLELDP